MTATVGIEEIEVNGKTYRLKGALQEGLVEEFPDNVRESGQQHLSDRRLKSAWLMRKTLGIGTAYLVAPDEEVMVKESHCEDRWGEITQGMLQQDSVGIVPGGLAAAHSMTIADFAGALGRIWITASTRTTIKSGVFTGADATWNDTTALLTVAGPPNFTYLYNAVVLGDRLVFAYKQSDTAADSVVIQPLTAWTTTDTPRTVAVSSGDQDADKLLLLAWNPTTTIIAAYDDSAKEVQVFKNTDDWATTTVTRLATIRCGALNALTTYYDLSGNLKPVVGLDNGVWAIDTATADNEQQVINLSNQTDTNNCLGMTVWNSALIVPLGNGAVESRLWNGSNLVSQPIPQPRLPANWEGHVTASIPTDDWLFVAYGGHAASKRAHVFAIGLDGRWHYVVENDTANEDITHMIISTYDDGTSRLHWFVENGADVFHVERPLDNPRNATVKCAASSAIELAEFAGGMPHIPKLALQWALDVEGLAATTAGEYVDAIYGIDATAPATDLGNFLSGDKDLSFGTSAAGIEFKTLSLKPTLIRDAGNTIDRIYIRSMILEYLAVPDRRETYEGVVDCEESAKARGGSAQVKDIVDELNTIQGSKTMVTLSFDGRTAVRVIAEPKTITEQELVSRFQITGYSHRVDRYLKLTELL